MDIRCVKFPAPQVRQTKKQKWPNDGAETARADFESTCGNKVQQRQSSPPRVNPQHSPCRANNGPLIVSGANLDAHQIGSPLSSKPHLQLTFPKEDDSYVLEGDQIAFDKEACLAVAQALALNHVDHDKLSHLSLRDLAAQLGISLQSALPLYLDEIFHPVVILLSVTFVLIYKEGAKRIFMASLVAD